MSELPPEAQTLFQIYRLEELPRLIEQAEPEVRRELEGRAGFLRTGIRDIDYLVDQIRFFAAARADAERRGLQGLAALEWAEYLSWPECQRRAGTLWRRARAPWRRALLRHWAFEERLCAWQRALHARSSEEVPGPPRTESGFPSFVDFGPYPSEHRIRALRPVGLSAHIRFDSWTKPGPFTPVRRLNNALTWTLQASAGRFYGKAYGGMAEIVIDEPRDYSVEEARAELLARADFLERGLSPDAAAPTNPNPMPAEVVTQWRQAIAGLRATAAEINHVDSRRRADLLESLFAEPGTLWLVPVEILPEDLPPEWLGVFLGFAFERRGVLSARERKQLRKSAAGVLAHWQASKFPAHELSEKEVEDAVARLSGVRRLLQGKSLFKYLAKVVRGVEREAGR